MAFKVPCPNCGLRDIYEFKFGLEVKEMPGPDAGLKEWRHYFYFNQNVKGVQTEWWYHTAGCGTWFTIKRNTSSNEIIEE